MNKCIFFVLMMPLVSFAGWKEHCSPVKEVRAWPSGSDAYGVYIYTKYNPPHCGGYWLKNDANNKDLVTSMVLVGLTTKYQMCFQYDEERQPKQGNLCQANSIRLKNWVGN